MDFWQKWRKQKSTALWNPADLTFEHMQVLQDIRSPWISAVFSPGVAVQTNLAAKKTAFRASLGQMFEDEVVEFWFVLSRSAGESRAVLATGRAQFTQAAKAAIAKTLSHEALKQVVAFLAKGGNPSSPRSIE
jgi:hypothetical protein